MNEAFRRLRPAGLFVRAGVELLALVALVHRTGIDRDVRFLVRKTFNREVRVGQVLRPEWTQLARRHSNLGGAPIVVVVKAGNVLSLQAIAWLRRAAAVEPMPGPVTYAVAPILEGAKLTRSLGLESDSTLLIPETDPGIAGRFPLGILIGEDGRIRSMAGLGTLESMERFFEGVTDEPWRRWWFECREMVLKQGLWQKEDFR